MLLGILLVMYDQVQGGAALRCVAFGARRGLCPAFILLLDTAASLSVVMVNVPGAPCGVVAGVVRLRLGFDEAVADS